MCEQTLQQACSQGYPGSARCVQSFDDSLDSAIRKTYRISLRSSSMWEPRHPSLKVVWYIPSVRGAGPAMFLKKQKTLDHARRLRLVSVSHVGGRFVGFGLVCMKECAPRTGRLQDCSLYCEEGDDRLIKNQPTDTPTSGLISGPRMCWYGCFRVMNDPTAGSPTVTLLRLHLPLNKEI